MALVGQNSRVCHHGDENENVKNQLVKREFKIPRLGRLQKRRLKSDFANYETLVRLSQLGHNVLSLVSIWSLRSLKKSSAIVAIIWKPLFTAIAAIAKVLRCIAYVHAFQDGCQLACENIRFSSLFVACVAWRFWLGALSNKGGRGQRNREEIGVEFRGYAAPSPGSTKPPCYAGYALRRWGRFARRNVCGRNSIRMTQINVYLTNPVVMGFQI